MRDYQWALVVLALLWAEVVLVLFVAGEFGFA
jgi:hypothetical protein